MTVEEFSQDGSQFQFKVRGKKALKSSGPVGRCLLFQSVLLLSPGHPAARTAVC